MVLQYKMSPPCLSPVVSFPSVLGKLLALSVTPLRSVGYVQPGPQITKNQVTDFHRWQKSHFPNKTRLPVLHNPKPPPAC